MTDVEKSQTKSNRTRLILGVCVLVLIVLLILLGPRLVPLAKWFVDFILHLDVHLGDMIQRFGFWIYLILLAIVFCETGLVVTPILPGDSLLFAAGGFAATGDLNLAILYISHDLMSVASLCHRIAILHDGQIAECGTPKEIFAHPQHSYSQRLIDSLPAVRSVLPV